MQFYSRKHSNSVTGCDFHENQNRPSSDRGCAISGPHRSAVENISSTALAGFPIWTRNYSLKWKGRGEWSLGTSDEFVRNKIETIPPAGLQKRQETLHTYAIRDARRCVCRRPVADITTSCRRRHLVSYWFSLAICDVRSGWSAGCRGGGPQVPTSQMASKNQYEMNIPGLPGILISHWFLLTICDART